MAAKIKPSKYQQRLLDWCDGGEGNVLVQACAGSGKTTTITMMVDKLVECNYDSILVVAFNKAIALELEKRMPREATCCTLHSFGFAAIRKNVSGVRVDNRKLMNTVDTVLAHIREDEAKVLKADLLGVVPIVMSTLTDPTDFEAVFAAAERCGRYADNPQSVFPHVQSVIEAMGRVKNFICFDEMITMPVTHGYEVPKFDIIFVDESQDLNESQAELIAKAMHKDSYIVAVGDRYQSIYGFRGADPRAMSKMQERFDMEDFGLPVCYRCGKRIVELAQSIVGTETIMAHDKAHDGEVVSALAKDIETNIQGTADGDMVICRVNAPLVSHALRLIREGRKAVVRGRDIGATLAALVKRMKAGDVTELIAKIGEWSNKEMQKAQAADNQGKAQVVDDTYQTIMAFVDGCDSQDVSEVLARIESTFSDDVKGVVFSSIHRAKGLEAPTVVVLGPELMPHPMAKGPVAQEQEKNIQYVAFTRAIDKLVLQPLA